MTPGATPTDILKRRIAQGGPISVADYMSLALGDPEWGYYMTREPFGTLGDFTTAPEISQMFGELIGLWCAVTWAQMGAPDRVVLAEMGPGRGTLMADLLRATANQAGFSAAREIWLVETSPRLKARQHQTLDGHDVHWVERFEDLPPGPLLLVANELFDALPVRQFVRGGGVWRERMIGVSDGALAFQTGNAITPDLDPELLAAEDGAIAEICEPGRALAAAIGQRLAAHPGAALIIDYGPARPGLGDTLQAVRQHAFHPPLDHPGEADITAHVDFAALAVAARPATAFGPIGQGAFLRLLGIETRAAMLAATQPAKAETVISQMRRLIDPAEMGTLFKVLALASPTLPAPPGFPSA